MSPSLYFEMDLIFHHCGCQVSIHKNHFRYIFQKVVIATFLQTFTDLLPSVKGAKLASEFVGDRCDGESGVGVINGVVFGVVGMPKVLAEDPCVTDSDPCAAGSTQTTFIDVPCAGKN